MSNWGLLGGLGRGIVQASGTIQQGLAADETAKRAEEREARNQASIEKRWARQDAQQAKRDEVSAQQRTEDVAWREERAKAGDAQNDRGMKIRESQAIESNIGGIMKSKQEAEKAIVKRFEKMSVDQFGNPLPTEQAAQLQAQMEAEILKTRKQYEDILQTRVQSYGERLRGTGFAYLLDIPETEKPDPLKVTTEGPYPSNERTTTTTNRDDIYAGLLNGSIIANDTPPAATENDNSKLNFGDPSDPSINAFQAVGRSIGNNLGGRHLTEEEMNNSSSGGLLMPRRSLVPSQR